MACLDWPLRLILWPLRIIVVMILSRTLWASDILVRKNDFFTRAILTLISSSIFLVFFFVFTNDFGAKTFLVGKHTHIYLILSSSLIVIFHRCKWVSCLILCWFLFLIFHFCKMHLGFLKVRLVLQLHMLMKSQQIVLHSWFKRVGLRLKWRFKLIYL